MSGTYADLEVWQSAMTLAVQIYRVTKSYPREETYGITSQIRRAAVSIASNIAEGKGRASDKELIHFLCTARGSLFELKTQLAIARELGYGDASQYPSLQNNCEKIGRMLNGLIRSVSPDKRGPVAVTQAIAREAAKSTK